MAKFSSGYSLNITKTQMHAVQLKADGWPMDRIAMVCFNVLAEDGVTADPKKMAKAKDTLRRWFKNEKIQKAYKEILLEYMNGYAGAAIKKLGEQINAENAWVANKAANDVLNRVGDLFNDNEKEMVIRVEGGPKIGHPGDGDKD